MTIKATSTTIQFRVNEQKFEVRGYNHEHDVYVGEPRWAARDEVDAVEQQVRKELGIG